MSLQALLDDISVYNADGDTGLIEKAYYFAEKAHAGQWRDSGVDFFQHPLEVAKILVELEMDPVTICAGLLHDVLEDTSVTRDQLEADFGPEVCLLVDGVTKLKRISFQSKEEHQAQSLRKMFLAMAEDLRVVLIKLADRLHNMRTLIHISAERQKKISRETLEIYTPLAHRLGMWGLKWEMEDLALRYLKPEAYDDLRQRISKKRLEREGELEQLLATLKENLAEIGIAADVTGRSKHFYSIYQKMSNEDKDLEEIYDLLAVRVVVDTVKDCYGVLGIVHTLWKPVPGRFKDYIAMPKSNMYQSLHTTVIGPEGDPFELQIRTHDMHRIAEKGIAAHWLYKEGQARNEEFEEKVAWLRQVMEWLREMRDPQEFMETLKIDLFEDEVFVFTPKGDVKTLPAQATPVDFAFSVHTDIGLHCSGARVNGRIVSLDYQLKNGEFVEVLTSKHAIPRQDWLRFVKTSKARSKIRSFLKDQQRDESIAKGKDLLEKEALRFGFDAKEVMHPDKIADAAKKYGVGSPDDLFAAIGFGTVTVVQLLGKLVGTQELELKKQALKVARKRRTRPRGYNQGVRIKGMDDDFLVRVSKCCGPVPGDRIIGYITRGRGVSVHRTDCPNMMSLGYESERHIAVEWVANETGSYPVEIEVEANDRVNLLTNIMTKITEGDTNIVAVNARTTKNKVAAIHVIVNITDIDHMQDVMYRIRQVKGVLDVRRAHPT